MLPPLAFHPVLKERAWGSARLRTLGKALPPGARIGESWEIADLPDSIPGGQSIVAGGRFDGMTLRELISAQRDGVLGVTTPGPDGAFPLLVKYLDAAENLSVQVHPSAAYARIPTRASRPKHGSSSRRSPVPGFTAASAHR